MSETHVPSTDANAEPNTLVMADPSLAGGFIQLPRTILYARNLSRDAKLLYAILLGYAWHEAHCFPGYGRLCQDMQASENMVRKYMQELQTAGLLRQKRRGLGKTNVYTLCDIRTAKIEVLEQQKSAVQDPTKTAAKEETEEQKRDQYPSNPRMAHADRREESSEQIHDRTGTQRLMGTGGFTKLDRMLARRAEPEQALAADERRAIAAYLRDYSQRFQDRAGPASSVSRACNLYRRARLLHPELTLSTFLGRLEEAASITKDCAASIRTTRMGYYFGVVEDLLGLRQAKPPDRAQQDTQSGHSTRHKPDDRPVISTLFQKFDWPMPDFRVADGDCKRPSALPERRNGDKCSSIALLISSPRDGP